MMYSDLEKLAYEGKLKVNKVLYRMNVRLQYIYASKKIKDIMDLDDDYFKIKETRKIPYRIFRYYAQTPDMSENQSYKIRKGDYESLLKILNEASH